jgi:hypothetical protein
VAKALAAVDAMEFSREMCFYDILLKVDALQIVIAVKLEGRNCSRFGHLVDRIKEDLRHL